MPEVCSDVPMYVSIAGVMLFLVVSGWCIT